MARDKIPEEWGPFVPDGHVGPGWAVGPLGIRVGVRVPRYSTAAPSANIRIAHRQGSHFRRNFGEIPEKIPFPLVTGKRNFATFR